MSFLSLPVFVDAAARATVILASTGLAAAALRRSSASTRHLVWVFGLMSALAVPALSAVLPKWEVPVVRIAAAPATAAAPSEGHAPAPERSISSLPGRSGMDAALSGGAVADPGIPTFRSDLPASTILLLVWAAGAALVLGRMLVGLAAVQWMSRRTRRLPEGSWLAVARELAADLGLSGVRFVQSATASMPMAWGVWRGSVLMPADAGRWPAHRLRVVLLHELAHVKRRDCLTHLVAQVVCAAYWFNPLAWIAARRLRAERERACDDLVLGTGTRGSDYADELLDIARVMRSQRFPAVMAGATLAMAHRSQLEGRLIAILDPTVPRRGLTRARTATAAAVFAVLIASVGSVQPWAARAAAKAPVADANGAPVVQAPAEQPARERERRPARTLDTAIGERVATEAAGAIAASVSGAVQGIAGGVAGGIAGGVAGGVIEGVTTGVVHGVTESLERIVDRAMPLGVQTNPGPAPEPRPAPAGQRGDVDPRAVTALMDALKDTDKDVRETAMQALVQMRDPRMLEPLVAALKDASPDVREQAVFALGQIRDHRAVDPLVSALKDENTDVREQAAFALGQIREARAVEALVIALKDGNPGVREQVAFALGQIRDPRAIDGLTAAMKDANADVRRQAAFALGQIRY